MIDQTFTHCRGIAKTLNARIQAAGVLSWQEALGGAQKLPLSEARKLRLLAEIQASQEALSRQDIAYLVACFPTHEKWRILAHFWPELSFLDLETTGLSPSRSHITVAALWQGGQLQQFIKGDNLRGLLPQLEACRLLVTFGGGSFDVPRLVDHFRIPELPCPHIDLRWQCYHQGLRGGQKQIERLLGLQRDASLAGVDGLEAIALWADYQSGNLSALSRLQAYVAADVAMLRAISHKLLVQLGAPLAPLV